LGRLDQLPPYLFAEIDAARDAARAAGRDVVDLGVGDPDLPTPAALVEKMARAVRRPEHHRYPDYQGSPELRSCLATWLQARHGIRVDPDRHLLVLIGSKEGLAHLPQAVLQDGDEVLIPDPGYPVYTEATLLAGGVPVPFRLRAKDSFMPRVADLERPCGPRTRLLFLNYPNNPTGAVADRPFFEKVVHLARDRGLAVVNDGAYLEVAPGESSPPSLLQVADIENDRVIEFHSLSKTFNMTGWRIGFAVGHADLIRDLGRLKKSIDSGVFGAVQEVACLAYGPRFEELIRPVMAVYPMRRRVIVEALAALGIEVFPTPATFYVWARVPEPEDSVTFCRRVLEACDLVVTPGVGFGPGGEGWFRISLTAPEERLTLAAERLGRL
jgi:LL-diaminopimelate aminotransferase